MITTNKPLVQWELNRVVEIASDREFNEVHYYNRNSTNALVVEPNEDGTANVPNILLQESEVIVVWLVRVLEDGTESSVERASFSVVARKKPEDYVYASTEIKTYASLEKRIENLEKNGVSGGSASVEQITDIVEEELTKAKESGEFDGPPGVSGVYVGSGEMPEGYNVQIDPSGEVELSNSKVLLDITLEEDVEKLDFSFEESESVDIIMFPAKTKTATTLKIAVNNSPNASTSFAQETSENIGNIFKLRHEHGLLFIENVRFRFKLLESDVKTYPGETKIYDGINSDPWWDKQPISAFSIKIGNGLLVAGSRFVVIKRV